MKLLLAAIPGLCLGLSGADSKVPLPSLPPPVLRRVDFSAEVYPLFKAACFRCHGPEKQKGKYRMDTREGAFRATERNGPAFKPGDSKGSAAVLMMAGLIDEMLMPPPGGRPGESDPLTAGQIGIIRAWIDQGAEWPDGPIAEVLKPVMFETDVRPLLKASCGSCHSGASAEGSFRIDSAASVMKGGAGYGAAVMQGNPGRSPLIAIVSGKDEDIPKPERHRLPDKQVQTLREWIQQGAK